MHVAECIFGQNQMIQKSTYYCVSSDMNYTFLISNNLLLILIQNPKLQIAVLLGAT